LVVEKLNGSIEKALKACNRRFSINTIYMILEDILSLLIMLEENAKTISNFDISDWFLGRRENTDILYLVDSSKICPNTETNFKSALFCTVNLLKKLSPRSRFLNLLLQEENSFYRSKKNFTDFKTEILGFIRTNFDVDPFLVRERMFDWILIPYAQFEEGNDSNKQTELLDPIDVESFDVESFLDEYEKVAKEHLLQVKDVNTLYDLNVEIGSSKKVSMKTLNSPHTQTVNTKNKGKKVCLIF